MFGFGPEEKFEYPYSFCVVCVEFLIVSHAGNLTALAFSASLVGPLVVPKKSRESLGTITAGNGEALGLDCGGRGVVAGEASGVSEKTLVSVNPVDPTRCISSSFDIHCRTSVQELCR